MDQISFNPHPQGLVIGNVQGADMGSSAGPNAWPSVVASKTVSVDPTAKVVSLANIYRVPSAVRGDFAEDIDAAARFITCSHLVEFKVVFCSTSAPPADNDR
jgi:hypothetical protein